MAERKVAANYAWSLANKVLVAALTFAATPLLIAGFGRKGYGLLTLALSVNGLLHLMELSMPQGAVKYVSEWLAQGDRDRLNCAVSTGLLFAIGAGMLAAAVLLLLALAGRPLFPKVSFEEWGVFRALLSVSAFGMLVTFLLNYVSQLLNGAEEIAWQAKLDSLLKVLHFGLVCSVAVMPGVLGLAAYLFLYYCLWVALLPIKTWRWHRHAPIRESLLGGWDWAAFRPVVGYALALVSIGLFQLLFTQLRPVILQQRFLTPDPIGAVADLGIILQFPNFMLLVSGALMAALVPAISRRAAGGDKQFLSWVVVNLTKYFWLATGLLTAAAVAAAPELLTLYVGRQHARLAPEMSLLLASSSINFWLAPVASVLLGLGQMRRLTQWVAITSVAGVVLVWVLCPRRGVQGVAVATLIYTALQACFYLFYYAPRVLQIKTWPILKGIAPPYLLGLVAILAGRGCLCWLGSSHTALNLISAGVAATSVYCGLAFTLHVKPAELLAVWKRIRA